jgi:choline dehydrogenase-like flavoprotein
MGTDVVDAVIVGAGPAGSVCAHTLAARGFSVVCLEQGDWVNPGDFPGSKPEFELLTRSTWAWNPNRRGLPEDYPINDSDAEIEAIMYNGVGGSSLLYGAHWMRLLPSDFRVRSLDDAGDDWPISYEDLAPFYTEVEEFVGVSGLGGDPAYPDWELPLPPLPMGRAGVHMAKAMNALGWHWWPGSNAIPSWAFKNMAQCVRWGVCERGCPAGAKASFDLAYWPHATRAGARLVTRARVARITLDQHGLASGADYIDGDGNEHHIAANAVIVAANGVGTARLLLMSNDVRPDGLANSSGLVGKNLMLHPNVGAMGLYDEELETWNGPAGQLMYSLEFYETGADRDFVRGAKWNLMPVPGVLSALEQFQDLPFEERWGTSLHEQAAFAGRVVGWYANVEDLPEESNCVTLDPELTDSDGLPAPVVTYRMSDNTRRNAEFSLARIVEAHEAAGAAKIVVAKGAAQSFAAAGTASSEDYGVFAPGHLLGTARMGDDPATSVVDRFGRSHDVPNLYIADGSAMVTSGGVNPTATIAALSLRMAKKLADTASRQRIPA